MLMPLYFLSFGIPHPEHSTPSLCPSPRLCQHNPDPDWRPPARLDHPGGCAVGRTSPQIAELYVKVDKPTLLRYPSGRAPDGSGAAETSEPRQVREEAAVRSSLWVPPGCLSGCSFSVKTTCFAG